MLSPLGRLYGMIAGLRNKLYDRGTFRSHSLGARTISVGNITAGGTGKTPLVGFVADELASRGERVCILTRGYGRRDPGRRVVVSDWRSVLADAETGGDEPVELARRLLGKAVIVADADRTAAGLWAKEEFGITAFILDDGFQHRRVRRDLDIVCIDATDPFGNGRVLPAGILREPASNLNRADVVLLTRANLAKDPDAVFAEVRLINTAAPVFIVENHISAVLPLESFIDGASAGHDVPIPEAGWFAFCGLGNPNGFFDQLRQQNFDLKGTRAFPDHTTYSEKDLGEIAREARASGAERLLTTAKDAVKLTSAKIGMPCSVAYLDLKISDEEGFRKLL